jgi:23S rRNA pseudouridine1911/1915/1917 synthase
MLDRPFLHAARLTIAHPSTGETMTFEAPLAPDLADVLAALRHAQPARVV